MASVDTARAKKIKSAITAITHTAQANRVKVQEYEALSRTPAQAERLRRSIRHLH